MEKNDDHKTKYKPTQTSIATIRLLFTWVVIHPPPSTLTGGNAQINFKWTKMTRRQQKHPSPQLGYHSLRPGDRGVPLFKKKRERSTILGIGKPFRTLLGRRRSVSPLRRERELYLESLVASGPRAYRLEGSKAPD